MMSWGWGVATRVISQKIDEKIQNFRGWFVQIALNLQHGGKLHPYGGAGCLRGTYVNVYSLSFLKINNKRVKDESFLISHTVNRRECGAGRVRQLCMFGDTLQLSYILDYNNIVQMAYLIEQPEAIRLNPPSAARHKSRFNQTTLPLIQNKFIFIRDGLAKGAARMENLSLVLEQTPSKVAVRYLASKIHKKLSLLVTLEADAGSDQLQLKAQLVNLQGGYGKVVGKQRRKLLTKYLCSRAGAAPGDFRIGVNVETAELKFWSPVYKFTLIQNSSAATLGVLLQWLTRQLAGQLRMAQEHLINVVMLTEGQFGCLYPEIQARKQEKRMVQTGRFSKFMNVFLNLAKQRANQELNLAHNLRKEADSFQRLKQDIIPIESQLSSLLLFSPFGPKEASESVKREQLQLSFLQRAYISERLQLPHSQKSSIPNENFFVLNYIKVNKKLSQTMIKKIKVGGFTTIYLSEIQYWYVGSYCVGVVPDSYFQGTPPLKKYIIIKREDKKVVQMSGKSRVAHERFILTKIKFGLSMFLPKYYILAEKDNSYENDLLVDYIGHPNLSDYIDKNRATLSFNTNIYFVLMIAQALRYLKEYRIAHLDLKPSNIMTHRRLNLKLIDFGQSYHPELLKTHQPGFSMPYSAPENYNFMESYDSKNDVFSLGVIMYELFVGKYPFYFHDEELRHRVYSGGTALDYWLESPEETLAYGDPIIMPLVYLIMGKCLSADPRERPELEWVALLFRQFIESLK